MNGYKLTRFDNAINCLPVRDDRYPEHSQWIPQYKLEQVLRDKVQELEYVDFRIGTEFLSLEQRGDKVFVRARRSDTDEVETIEPDYVVGADGARDRKSVVQGTGGSERVN